MNMNDDVVYRCLRLEALPPAHNRPFPQLGRTKIGLMINFLLWSVCLLVEMLQRGKTVRDISCKEQ